VSSSFLEIVQLANGEIALKRSDDEGEPLVNIRFSEEAHNYIGAAGLDIAKVMIQAGIQAAAHINESLVNQSMEKESNLDEPESSVAESFADDETDSGQHILH